MHIITNKSNHSCSHCPDRYLSQRFIFFFIFSFIHLSALSCARHLGTQFNRTNAHRVQLADSTTFDIQGRTALLPCELKSFPLFQCFHVLPNLEDMDLVPSTDFLGRHGVTVPTRKSQIFIAARPGPVVLRANTHSPTVPEHTGAATEFLKLFFSGTTAGSR
jgi:hypothetical protein